MKRFIIFLLSLTILLSFSACGSSDVSDTNNSATTSSQSATNPASSENETSTEQGESSNIDSSTQPVKIKLTVNNETATVTLLDHDAARDFAAMLPLTLTFKDYNNTEKIATLPNELDIGNAPTSCDPDVGTFAYYAPWGNLSMFYQDFRESNSLILLGTFNEGIEIFANLNGEFTVTIEKE